MKLEIRDGLPFVKATVHYRGQSITIANVLLDTGSAGSVFRIDSLIDLGVKPEPQDLLHRITGVGGSEYVFSKVLDRLTVGDLLVEDYSIEVGAMDYDFDLQGIIGFDFLTKTKALLNLESRELLPTR